MAEELEIEIGTNGQVHVHVKGAKGKKCLDYVALFREILGTVEEQQLTPEYYEAETHAQVEQRLQQK